MGDSVISADKWDIIVTKGYTSGQIVYKPNYSSLPTIQYVMIHKIIHVYHLNKLHGSLNMSYILLNRHITGCRKMITNYVLLASRF